MIKKYRLFTTQTCRSCPQVKDFMSKIEMEGENIDASTPDGREEAGKLGIMSVPTVLFLDENEKVVEQAQSIKQIQKVLDI